MSDQQQGFWSSIPGILTGLAALVTAVSGLYLAVSGNEDNSTAVVEKVEHIEAPVINAVDSPSPVKEALPDANNASVSLTTLVDCKKFPTVNTIGSLMSWSNYYHKQIISSGATKDACDKAIAYRSQAHCKKQQDLTIRQGLSETLSHCSSAGYHWKDVQQ